MPARDPCEALNPRGTLQWHLDSFYHMPLRALDLVMEHYHYESLSTSNSIRILELLPGKREDALRARMNEAELTTEPYDPAFAALSYCWGTPIFDADLICNEKTLKITQSLAAALRYIRDQDTVIPLWVDQVCINQQDIPERNAQVKLMGQIYSKAIKVVIWLGEEDVEVPLKRRAGRIDKSIGTGQEIGVSGSRLKDLIERLAKAQVKRHEVGDTRNKHELQWLGLKKYGLPDMGDPGYVTFTRLLQRQYFSRGWILQEATLAIDNIVRIGAVRVSLMDFYGAIYICSTLGFNDELRADDVKRFISIINMRVALREKTSMDLLKLLLQTRATITTDPRDKIYCLLGLASDRELLNVEPNYGDSVENVYRSFTLRHIECYGNLDILSVPRTTENATLPTWVVDWRSDDTRYFVSLDGRDADQDCQYRATKETRTSITGSPDSNVIGLSGFSMDSVIKCGCRYRSVDADPEWSLWRQIKHAFHAHLDFRLRYLDWKYVSLLHTSKPYVTGEKREDVFWRCLTAGRAFESNADLDVARENYQAWSKQFFLYPTLRWLLPEFLLIAVLGLLQCLRMLRTGFALCCWVPLYGRNLQQEAFTNLCGGNIGRVIILTGEGYMGLAPEATKKGDSIALFKGGKLPFVVRKKGENWVIIGNCYIHGIMNGEAFDDARCNTMWIE